jgi:hypothetical protein
MPKGRNPRTWPSRHYGSLAAFFFEVLLVATLAPLVVADSSGTVPANVDPKNDPRNPLKYIANNTLTTIGLGEHTHSLSLWWCINGTYSLASTTLHGIWFAVLMQC